MNFRCCPDEPTKVSFERHLSPLEREAGGLLREIPNFVRSLGNVVEWVRLHRIVYVKPLSSGTFRKIKPRSIDFVISIRKSGTEPASVITIRSSTQSKNIKTQNCGIIRFN